jgi:transcriptional regulator with XRE-family HTH domain
MSRNENALKELGKNLQRLRKNADLTQEQLAELCEFDPTYISLLERGKRNPPYTTLLTIAESMEIHLSELVAT